ncbi:hypothetical protein C7293_00825 [filamentous cyanobacterium CCT1]|nr:hypothetical protein C7293_00825 [filamentous cyanobacterium CCT1]PSN80959.1 hypothetical protein C8B47_03840 [filamentous cyanobacterium CCP4]
MKKNPAESTFILLSNYSFELTETNVNDMVFGWLSLYPGKWVVAAIVEAIYQGRYKVESVSRILSSWNTKGYPAHHFDYDFADVVCKQLVNLGTYRVSKSNREAMKTMQHQEHTVSEQLKTEVNHQREGQNLAEMIPKKHCKTGFKNTPNQKIGECERLVVHITA